MLSPEQLAALSDTELADYVSALHSEYTKSRLYNADLQKKLEQTQKMAA